MNVRNYVCAIFVSDGRILLGKRSPHRKAYAGNWDVVGGLVERGESLEDALVREVGEEVGVTPTAWDRFCAVRDTGPGARGDAIYHMFLVRAWNGGQPAMANDEHTELKWFTIAEACSLEDLALEAYRDLFRSIAF
jgi:ADP-ribose pyrophosphatase YjhB (NUDIX family)